MMTTPPRCTPRPAPSCTNSPGSEHGQVGPDRRRRRTGTAEFAAGAGNVDKWNVTWTQQRGGLFNITVLSLISQFGDGIGIHVGTQWQARFEQTRGFTVLRMVQPGESFDQPESGFPMCT